MTERIRGRPRWTPRMRDARAFGSEPSAHHNPQRRRGCALPTGRHMVCRHARPQGAGIDSL